MAWMLEAVEKHGAKVLLVHLTCDPKKLTERVGEASRQSKGKIVNAELLGQLLETYNLFTPYPARPSLHLDTTNTSPHETAATIAAYLQRGT